MPGAQALYNGLRLAFKPTYREDGLLTVHNADFTRDREFRAAYESALRQDPGTRIRWRAHVTQWAGFHASLLGGDFVECGVNRAFLSMSVMTYVDFRQLADRNFYLFDTFSGLVPEALRPRSVAAPPVVEDEVDPYEPEVAGQGDDMGIEDYRPLSLDEIRAL